MLDVQSVPGIREGGEMGMGMGMETGDAFPDFLDGIDFDDLFLDDDILPDLLSSYSAAASENNKPDSSGSSSSTSSGAGKKDDKEKRVTSNHVKKKSTTASSKNSGGKRKVKVDWTPELHRRFVQAVEQLGVDKAVPSRILEIMGIDCLTRHNIASHLQKYRSHRKHLVAREAEAASWSQRRQLYKREPMAMGPTMGFPTMQMQMQLPLHVWGHPKAPYSQYPPPPHRGAVGMPCYPHPPPLPLPLPPLPPPHSILPSKESIDAAIGDVMAKPWLPLPLGLKPPCMEGVMGNLQCHGVPDLPPSTSL